MVRLALVFLIVAMVVFGGLAALSSDQESGTTTARADLLLPVSAASTTGFERAIEPYEWRFPADHGPHPAFQTEWWYYTGNLVDAAGIDWTLSSEPMGYEAVNYGVWYDDVQLARIAARQLNHRRRTRQCHHPHRDRH